MGHDIFFIKKRKVEKHRDECGHISEHKQNDLGYLRYSASNINARHIYKALNSGECDGGISGNGTELHILETTIKRAINYFDKNFPNTFDKEKQELLKVYNEMTNPSLKGFAEFIGGVKRKDWKFYVVFG